MSTIEEFGNQPKRIEYENQKPIYFTGGEHSLRSDHLDNFIKEFENSIYLAIDRSQPGQEVAIFLESNILDTAVGEFFRAAIDRKVPFYEAYKRALFVDKVIEDQKFDQTQQLQFFGLLAKKGIYSLKFGSELEYTRYCSEVLETQTPFALQTKFQEKVLESLEKLNRHAKSKGIKLDINIEAFENGSADSKKFLLQSLDYDKKILRASVEGEFDQAAGLLKASIAEEREFQLHREQILTRKIIEADSRLKTSATVLMYGFAHRHLMNQFVGEKILNFDNPNRTFTHPVAVLHDMAIQDVEYMPDDITLRKAVVTDLIEGAYRLLSNLKKTDGLSWGDDIFAVIEKAGGIEAYIGLIREGIFPSKAQDNNRNFMQKVANVFRKPSKTHNYDLLVKAFKDPDVVQNRRMRSDTDNIGPHLVFSLGVIHQLSKILGFFKNIEG